ncbi:hypothetical protein OC25_10150 [Pedobacter kyungheensis]|uniref:Uncharacterized protein n=1 Tax=Pedobacter kyungheensis TaxID=1069985 RepID=A0A0C1DA46_9SPHI|nr:hypothetical protein [Pedobacter kyungheensis]KIA94281.1 hypothetical protein OC25_10150 [Pedobacter kyungheensis]
MNLSDVILNCNEYVDVDESIHMVFAKKIDNKFQSSSEAVVLKLSPEELELKVGHISNSKCPGYTYFLEMFIIQDFWEGLKEANEYYSDKDIVNRVIYYAEFDA